MSDQENNELNSSLAGSFGLRKTEGIPLDQIRAIVENEIRILLDKNLEKLMTILYRIDVSQRQTEEIFTMDSKDKIASLLADAVIQRQLLKIKTRKEFKDKL